MRVLIIRPLLSPFEKEIDGTLSSMQSVVGGRIQVIYPFEDDTVALICNDEGKIEGLPLNRALTDDHGRIYDIIAGTFFICSAPPDSESFADLSEEQIRLYTERFARPEIYI